MKTQIKLSSRAPRNPLVAPAHFRRAGSHRPGGGALRQQAARVLRRELDQFARGRPGP